MSRDFPENSSTPAGDKEKPYFTPREVSQEPLSVGFIGSKRMWLGLIGGVVLAGGALAAYSYQQADYIRNFGNGRRGPFEMDFDESVREGEEAQPTVQQSTPAP